MFTYLKYLPLYFIIASCDMKKTVNVVLPAYNQENVVECYVEIGKPISLLASKSISYFESSYPDVKNSLVTISSTNYNDTLFYRSFLDDNTYLDTLELKTFNYRGKRKFGDLQGNSINLNMKNLDGTVVTGTTSIPYKVNIDSMNYSYDSENKKYSLKVLFQDNQSISNYYRLFVNINGLVYGGRNIDYTFTDENLLTSKGAVITSYRFNENDTLITTLYHLTKEHYNYISSTRNADNANGNPFAQPAAIKSNITGGIGIFTGIAYDRDTIIIKKK